ncbi:hypothetical protein PGB90_005700 [Kerria lacca]
MFTREEDPLGLFDRRHDIYSLLNLVYENGLIGCHSAVASFTHPISFLSRASRITGGIITIILEHAKKLTLLMLDGLTLMRLVSQTIAVKLYYFNILPLSDKETIALHLVLKKLPDLFWENIIPYPYIFFEESILDAEASRGKITATKIMYESEIDSLNSNERVDQNESDKTDEDNSDSVTDSDFHNNIASRSKKVIMYSRELSTNGPVKRRPVTFIDRRIQPDDNEPLL